jgi:integrase/recombinase XerC
MSEMIHVPSVTREPLPFDLTIQSLLELFASGRNPRTLAAYRQDLEAFCDFTGAATVPAALRELLSCDAGAANAFLIGYRGGMVDRGLAPNTVNRRLAALRSLVKLARTVGLVSWSLEVPNVKSENYRDTRGPGLDAVARMFAELAGRKDPKAVRDRAILRLLFDLGLRRGEVVALDVADLDLDRGAVSVMGKARAQKELMTVTDAARKAIAAWLEVRGTEPGPLFFNCDRAGKGEANFRRLTGTGLYRMVRDLGKRVGANVRPHGIRHTAITQAVKAGTAAGMDLEEIKQFSRHSDVRTLMIYRDRERNVQGTLAGLVSAQI